MLERLPRRVRDLYCSKLLEHDLYVEKLYACLSLLDEILTDYEACDLCYTIGYYHYHRQWKCIERTFYKVLKRLPDNF